MTSRRSFIAPSHAMLAIASTNKLASQLNHASDHGRRQCPQSGREITGGNLHLRELKYIWATYQMCLICLGPKHAQAAALVQEVVHTLLQVIRQGVASPSLVWRICPSGDPIMFSIPAQKPTNLMAPESRSRCCAELGASAQLHSPAA